MPAFTINRSQKKFLKKSTSTATMTATMSATTTAMAREWFITIIISYSATTHAGPCPRGIIDFIMFI